MRSKPTPSAEYKSYKDYIPLNSSNDCFQMESNWQEQAKLHDYFPLQLRLLESCVPSQYITHVVIDADMPEHQHGMNSITSVEKDNTDFAVRGMLLHMPGVWRVSIEINYIEQASKMARMELIEFYDTL